MLTKKYNAFRREVKKSLNGITKKKKKITEPAFEWFIKSLLSKTGLFLKDTVYCRDGFVCVNELDSHTFQLLCFQINSFGEGIFGPKIKKLCTPILMTVRVHGSHHFLDHSLRDSCISIEDFYLGRQFTGSKGPLCDRDDFNKHARMLFLSGGGIYSFNHHIIYQLMNANYLCHHIAEVVGYAFGALDIFWSKKQKLFFLSSGSRFSPERDKLYIDIIDDFSGEKMRGYFQVPHYATLMGNIEKFKEEFDIMIWEVTYRNEIETFLLPVGYQKVQKRMFHKNVNVVTTQHSIEHVLVEYYRRKNAFVVAGTFQILEYLSRAMIAKIKGRDTEGMAFLKSASLCLGHYPERDFNEFYRKREDRYSAFRSECSHTMFFRPPVLL
ncbi:MAG: hypothetical protein V1789_12680 [PVC group bacterium]